MGLSVNKREILPLQVSYSITPMQSTIEASAGSFTGFYQAWEYHRYARREYEYVGMSSSQAQSLASSLVAQYNRAYRQSTVEGMNATTGRLIISHENAGTKLQGRISTFNMGGCMWGVRVSLSEDDCLIDDSPEEDAEVLFSVENGRNYDY